MIIYIPNADGWKNMSFKLLFSPQLLKLLAHLLRWKISNNFVYVTKLSCIFQVVSLYSSSLQWWSGAAEPGGSGGVGPPLEFEIYLVNFLKNCKKRGFFSIGPPLGKNRSSAPAYNYNIPQNVYDLEDFEL